MKNAFIKSCIICVFVSVSVRGNLPDDPSEYMQWESDSLAAIKAQLANEPKIAIPKLGGWLVKLSTGMNFEKGDRPVFSAAQKALLAIPGHAKYYQDKINKMRDELLAATKLSHEEQLRMEEEGQEIPHEPSYLGDTQIAIRTLKYMPSAETVSVLGYFLSDPVGRDGKSFLGSPLKLPGDSGPYLSNAEIATEVIRVLGIEQPPFKDNKGVITPAEIDAWKDWWNEVKSGKRTYRFIGSSVEYGPDGPATKEVIQHAERDRKRDEEREAGHRKSPIAPEAAPTAAVATKSFSIAGILAACALIVAAVWYFLRGRKAA